MKSSKYQETESNLPEQIKSVREFVGSVPYPSEANQSSLVQFHRSHVTCNEMTLSNWRLAIFLEIFGKFSTFLKNKTLPPVYITAI